MNFKNANPALRILGYHPQGSSANYLIGAKEEWLTDIPLYGGVEYKDIYPGIDLIFYGSDQGLEYDFALAVGAQPSSIRLSFDGVNHAYLEDGDLVLNTDSGIVRHRRPRIYQKNEWRRSNIPGKFVLYNSTEAGFETGSYDTGQPLVIDPVIAFGTFVGGAGGTQALAVAMDSSGSAYVAGQTWPLNFPTTFSVSASIGNQDAFLVKLNPAGTQVVYATYFGGLSTDSARGVAVDSTGNAYVTGFTYSSNFPVSGGAYRSPTLGQADAFVLKVNAAGSGIAYSALIGGAGNDFATGIAIDSTGSAYISGYTTSLAFPVTIGSLQPSYGGGIQDAFIAKLNAAGSALVYATYLGGSGNDIANAIAVDASGEVYVAGYTDSSNLPVSNALYPRPTGEGDAFVAKLTAAGSALVFSTYLGGTLTDIASALALDPVGNVYVAGSTLSTDFPVISGALQTVNHGSYDAFVSKLNVSGNALLYSTYLGGEGPDQATGIVVDASGEAYVGGLTQSLQFPVVNAVQAMAQGGQDAFAALVSAAGTSLSWSTYLGGSGDDQATGIAVDASGGVYVAGLTYSSNFPTTFGSYETRYNRDGDGFVIKLSPPLPSVVSVLPSSGNGSSQTFSFNYSNASGGANLIATHAMFNTSVNGAGACYVAVVPVNGTAWLANDAFTGWLGPITLGGAPATLQNSQCILNGALSNVVISGATAQLTLALSFQAAFSGVKNVYGYAQNAALNSGWVTLGNWTVPVGIQPPQAVSVAPSSGSGASQTFSFNYSNASGGANLIATHAMFNTSVNGAGECYVAVVPASGTAWLANDAFTGWLGPIMLGGAAATLQNSQCILNGALSSVVISGATAQLTLALSFQAAFSGVKNVYGYAQNAALSSGWTPLGTWVP